MDRRGFMFAAPVFGDRTFMPYSPPALVPEPSLGQQPAAQPPAPSDAGRTGTELITIIVLGAAVLAALEVAGVTNILGRRRRKKKDDSEWFPIG